jgi:hypothetical protein
MREAFVTTVVAERASGVMTGIVGTFSNAEPASFGSVIDVAAIEYID